MPHTQSPFDEAPVTSSRFAQRVSSQLFSSSLVSMDRQLKSPKHLEATNCEAKNKQEKKKNLQENKNIQRGKKLSLTSPEK